MSDQLDMLSEAEMRVLELLLQDRTVADIAAALHLHAAQTVDAHLASIRRKLGVRTNHGIVIWIAGLKARSAHA